jgi:3-hydroxy-3-methylglutaryl CoA synthase
MAGISAYGAYIPRLRLQRQSILAANGWFNPALKALAKGERAICNWDEDALTMAVEAARDCLTGVDRETVRSVQLASTSLPFVDRQNATVLAEALNLSEAIATADLTSSLRAATSAMVNMLNGAGHASDRALLVAGEHRQAKAAGAEEMMLGDAAAALVIESGPGIAEFIGSHQSAVDFVDHYRGQNAVFDYGWEERWIRDEGHLKIVPRAVAALLAETGLSGDTIDHFVVPLAAATVKRLARQLGISESAVADNLQAVLGDSGTAHPLIMLIQTLERATPGQTILVVGWGQGCDALLFRTTEALTALPARSGVRGSLARRREESNYNRYLAFNGLIQQEKGLRSELDKQTALSALYRNKEMILGFIGGRCTECGTVQFPKTNACVNPNCGKFHTQEDYPLADAPARIQSWTADNLTYSPDPPHHFGMVVFDDGGRLMADITDVEAGAVDVGMRVRMMFRVKDYDERRGFRRYFWKAAPADGETPSG